MSDKTNYNPQLIIPAGTQVVLMVDVASRADRHAVSHGAVGEVIAAPEDNSRSYGVRFTDGTELSLRRQEFAIRKHHQASELFQPEGALSDVGLYEYIIYSCVVGSRAYGLDDETSDVDRRGIYLPPAEMHWSLYGVPEQLENKDAEECYWEMQKFLTLALKANPNVLECLYSPLVETVTPLAQELLEIRSVFLSKLVYQTYNGYVLSQFKKLEQDLRTRGAIRWKHAMHLIRLLIEGISVLKEGFVQVQICDHRQQLVALKQGQIPWDEVNTWRLSLHKEFDAAFAQTRLPERPDYERVNAFLIHARRFSSEQKGKII